jgi:hypothetical protein
MDEKHPEYVIKKYHSGSDHSILRRVEIEIIDGKGTITEYWECA